MSSMKQLSFKSISATLITLIIMGVFAIPQTTHASFLGSIFGTNNSTYNSTSGQNTGNIKISKEVRDVANSNSHHDKITVRSGSLVEIWIEVKNTSSKNNALTTVTDQLDNGMVYVPGSLRVNGQTGLTGLTSGGLNINIPKKSSIVITYDVYMCGTGGYAITASAYSAGVGSATDAAIVATKNSNNSNYDQTSACISQVQNTTNQNSANTSSSSNNPFSDWTGVNNLSNLDVNNPFTGWTGVDNSNSTTPTNTPSTTTTNTNPFGDWTGVNNQDSQNNQSMNNPFGEWTGVSSSTANQNPFGDWTGVNSTDNRYTASGYSANTSANYSDSSPSNNSLSAPTNYVAPTTGVNQTAPFIFAGLMTVGFFAFRKRKFIFN